MEASNASSLDEDPPSSIRSTTTSEFRCVSLFHRFLSCKKRNWYKKKYTLNSGLSMSGILSTITMCNSFRWPSPWWLSFVVVCLIGILFNCSTFWKSVTTRWDRSFAFQCVITDARTKKVSTWQNCWRRYDQGVSSSLSVVSYRTRTLDPHLLLYS